MATSDFSAFDAVFQSKGLCLFQEHTPSIDVAFMATPKLSIIEKLPLAAPAMESMAIDVSRP